MKNFIPFLRLGLVALINPFIIGDRLSFVKQICSIWFLIYMYQNQLPLLIFFIQFSCTVGTRSADGLLSPFSGFFPDYHFNPGDSGHRVVRMGFYLAFLSVQVPVETNGEGHVQYIQVTFSLSHMGFSFLLLLFFFFALKFYFILYMIQCCLVNL